MPDESPNISVEEQRLLDAVAAEPKSDAPRLAYADYIEGNDPERAEYIRLDCAHAASSPPGVLRSKRGWLAELETWFNARMLERGFRFVFSNRGFVISATVDSGALLARADALFDRNPLLRDLTIRPASRDLPALAACPYLGRITALTIEPETRLDYARHEHRPAPGAELDDEALAAFVASPHLASVTRLSFNCASVGPATARAVARSEALRSLAGLGVDRDARMDAGAASELATRPRSDALVRLRIARCRIGPEGCAAIAASDLVAGVVELSLESSHVGDAGARALGASTSLSACRRLRLAKNGIGDEGAAALAGSSGLAGLEELDLTDNYIGDAGARAFAAAPHLDRLKALKLNQNGIREDGAEALASTERLPALEALGLSHNALYSDEVEQWTDWDGTPVGSGPARVEYRELVRRYGRRFEIV